MKRAIIFIVVSCLCLITGCSKQSESLNKDVIPLERFENTEYNAETDYQFFFDENADIVAVDDGYYAKYMGMLYFIDKKTLEKDPVCSNIVCEHNTEECDAYLGDAYSIQYYHGCIYYVLHNNGMMMLYKKSFDGSSAEKICDLFVSDIIPKICVHRGYAYYALYTGGKSATLYKVALETGAKPEALYVYEGYDADIQKLKGYGDGVMFIEYCSLDKEYTDFKFNICYYDSNENAVKSVLDDVSGDYTVIDGKVYYSKTDGVHCFDVSSGTDEIFYELDEFVFFSYDGKHLYLDNQYALNLAGEGFYFDDDSDEIDLSDFSQTNHRVYVIDLEGKLIDTIQVGYLGVYFGDEDYFLHCSFDGIFALDKNMIGTGGHEWIDINLDSFIEYSEY